MLYKYFNELLSHVQVHNLDQNYEGELIVLYHDCFEVDAQVSVSFWRSIFATVISLGKGGTLCFVYCLFMCMHTVISWERELGVSINYFLSLF